MSAILRPKIIRLYGVYRPFSDRKIMIASDIDAKHDREAVAVRTGCSISYSCFSVTIFDTIFLSVFVVSLYVVSGVCTCMIVV